jgi:HlyD family type I secretion membrane fusion protein
MSMSISLSSDSKVDNAVDSARNPLLIGGVAALLMALILIGWASVMTVAGGAIASGKVALEGNRKAVQHREGGPVRAILVREGQRVEKGQPLLELKSTDLQAEVSIIESSRLATLARLARLRAEARNEGSITWPEQLQAMRNDAQARSFIEQEGALFEARLSAYRGNVNLLQQQIDGRRRQIEGLEARLAATKTQLVSIDQEHASLLPLLEQGLVARPRVLGLERSSAALTADLQAIKSQADAERNGIQVAETQIAQLERDRQEAVSKEIAEMEARLADVMPRLTSSKERLQLTTIVAPETGYVYGLNIFNQGAVVIPGQTILEIVPDADSLVLSVDVNPKDVERVRPGQSVVVHLLAYSQRYQSVIRGRLEKVSADRFDDPQKQASFYKGVIKIDPAELKKANVELMPGMPVQVVIETGDRTIMAYLLDPIFHVTDYAFRER